MYYNSVMMKSSVETVMKDYLEGLITEKEMELSFPETINIFTLRPFEGDDPSRTYVAFDHGIHMQRA